MLPFNLIPRPIGMKLFKTSPMPRTLLEKASAPKMILDNFSQKYYFLFIEVCIYVCIIII